MLDHACGQERDARHMRIRVFRGEQYWMGSMPGAVFDTGDHLHPSTAGYLAMAEAVPLTLLVSGGH
jgi:hypothetical protein